MSTATEAVGESLPHAFNGQGAGDSMYFKSPNAAVKAMHSVKIEILNASKASADVAAETVGTLRLPTKISKTIEFKCIKIVEKAGIAIPSQVIIDELRAAKVAEAFGALGAYAVYQALSALVSTGAIRTETRENEIVYSMPSTNTMDFADNVAFENCKRAAAAVALNHPGSSETRIVNSLGKYYPIHLIVRALNNLVDEGVLFERVTEKFVSVVPPALGGSTMGDDGNIAERHFFIADETSSKSMEMLIGDANFLV
jgi:Fe2+ or Zn2+ uptake regulation protein